MSSQSSPEPSPSRLKTISARIGALNTTLGVLGALLGKFSELQDKLANVFPMLGIDFVHLGYSVVLGALFATGYGFLGYWIYDRFLRSQLRRIYFAAYLVAGFVLTGCTVYVALPPDPDDYTRVSKAAGDWERVLIGIKASSGGLRFNRSDPSTASQVWSTAQAIWGLLNDPTSQHSPAAIADLFGYIEKQRLPNDPAWGYMNQFEWGVTEVAGWVLLAEVASLSPNTGQKIWGGDLQAAKQRLVRDVEMLLRLQMKSGGWSPISPEMLTGAAKANGLVEAHERTYSTAIAVWALSEVRRSNLLDSKKNEDIDQSIRNGTKWLLVNYRLDSKTWTPNPARGGGTDIRYLGLTAQVLFVLERARPYTPEVGLSQYIDARQAFAGAILVADAGDTEPLFKRPINRNDHTHDSDSYLPDAKVSIEASTFLWFPWTVAFCSTRTGMQLSAEDAQLVTRGCTRIYQRMRELLREVESSPWTYVMAESLFAVNLYRKDQAMNGVGRSSP